MKAKVLTLSLSGEYLSDASDADPCDEVICDLCPLTDKGCSKTKSLFCPHCGSLLHPNKGWAGQVYDGYCNTCDTPVENGVTCDEAPKGFYVVDEDGREIAYCEGTRYEAEILREGCLGYGIVPFEDYEEPDENEDEGYDT